LLYIQNRKRLVAENKEDVGLVCVDQLSVIYTDYTRQLYFVVESFFSSGCVHNLLYGKKTRIARVSGFRVTRRIGSTRGCS